MSKRIGFIGAGIMGAGMARCLLRKGFEVQIYNRTRAKAEPLAKLGGLIVDSPAEAARDAEVVVTMLADPAAVHGVVDGPEGILASICRGAILIDSSTISPPHTKAIAKQLTDVGAHMLDCPVFGSKNEAENGALGLLVGGEREVLAKAQDVLDAMGKTNYLGPCGSGAQAKLVVNLVVASTLEAFNEGMVLAAKAGLNLDAMREMILGSRARSGIIEMKAPPMMARDFTPFFPLKLMAKDMRLALESAAELGVPLPQVAALKGVYEECLQRNLGDEDFSATVKYLEEQTGVVVKSA